MTFTSEVLKRESDQAIIVLLTISHPDMPIPIRVSSDGVDTLSRGNTFIHFPFDIVFPNQTQENRPRGRLQIDNVDQTVITAIRSLNSPLTVDIEIVTSNDPDTVEVLFPQFTLENIDYDALTISAELGVENLFSEPYPAGSFDPARFPGIF